MDHECINRLLIFTGEAPADCAAPDSGAVLADIQVPSDWGSAPASYGVKSLSGSWSTVAIGSGTAGHFRIKDPDDTTCYLQGSVTETDSGGDITLETVSVTLGSPVTITSFTFCIGRDF